MNNVTVQNPECLTHKHPGVEGICTRAGVITGWPDSLPELTQDLIDSYDKEYQTHLESIAYIEKRVAEYPSYGDQMGALMKAQEGDTSELTEILQKIKAVKKKFPKSV